MKAMTLAAPGGLENLQLVELDMPEPGPGEILVRIHANSLNYHDYVIAKGMIKSALGRVLMSDAAGEVAAVGEGVTAFQPGDRVFSVFYPSWLSGEGEPGTTAGLIPGENCEGYAREYAVVPWTWFTKAPAGYSHEEAAALTCAGLTAWRAVISTGQVKPGDVVLTQGTGGVSVFALQFAKAAGATVIATSSSPEKLDRLRALGADHVINYRETPDWGREAKALTGNRGVDLVVEVGGAGTFGQSIEACRMNGRISLVGVLAGISGEIPLSRAFTSQLTICGIRVGSRADQEEMVRGITATGLKPVLDETFPLEALADAYRRQEAQKHFGKICVSI